MTKILVIEDEETIRQEVADWLAFEGYTPLTASNGRMGLALARSEQPDLILCDITMPELSGHDVLLEVRADPQLNQTAFIFVTASAERSSIRKGMNMGAEDYLTKPFSHAEVLSAVRSQLAKKAQQTQYIQSRIDMLSQALEDEREQRALKSRLVAMFSHDFRNPLALILSYSGILRSYEDRLTAERKRQYLDRIDGSVNLLVQMLDDMLMVAEMESGHLVFAPQPVDLPMLVQHILDEFVLIDQNTHRVVLHSQITTPFILADAKILRQIITNLVSNALKYSPSDTQVTVTLSRENGNIRLQVEDQGIGIPQESIAHIGESFYRADNVRSKQGTGLGMSIVMHCVERHQGKLAINSVVDQGTAVTVELPWVEVNSPPETLPCGFTKQDQQ